MGPQSYTTHQSEFDVRVVDGWNLNIVNTSTGKNAPNPDKGKSWGTVNLLAQNNDMTLTCNEGKGTPMKDVPSMFITTNGKDSVIRIDSRGTHVVQINKQIKITSETQGIDIEAEGEKEADRQTERQRDRGTVQCKEGATERKREKTIYV